MRKFQQWYCSQCSYSHVFELVAGCYVSRQCPKTLVVAKVLNLRQKAAAFIAERRLAQHEHGG